MRGYGQGMESGSRTLYRVTTRSALKARALALVVLLIGAATLVGAVTIWTGDLWTGLIGRKELSDAGEWVRTDPTTAVRVVWSLGLGVCGTLLTAGGIAVVVQTRRSTTGRYGLVVGSDGLRVESSTTRFTMTWQRIQDVAVADGERARTLVITCAGTDLADHLGPKEVARRERQLRDLLHPRVTRADRGEVVRLSPLSALGVRESEFLDDVRRHLARD